MLKSETRRWPGLLLFYGWCQGSRQLWRISVHGRIQSTVATPLRGDAVSTSTSAAMLAAWPGSGDGAAGLHCEGKNRTLEEANEYLADIKKQKRYRRDVY